MKRTFSWFWTLQFSCWGLIGLLNSLAHHISRPPPLIIDILNQVSLTGGGLLITSIYRLYLKKQTQPGVFKAGKFVGSLLVATFIQGICWILLLFVIFLPVMHKYQIKSVELALNIVPLIVLLLIWNLSYLIYQLLRKYHVAEVEKWQMEAEVQKAQLGVLKSQINPHFLFNALNNIRSLILEDPQLAREMITQFSELFRYALQHADQKEITIGEELAVLRQYLRLVKLQYEDKFRYIINAHDAVSKETIPPMVLQLLAENAVKHGISQNEQGGEIIVDIEREADHLQLKVQNTGSLSRNDQLENSLGIGLNNVRERLRLLYADNALLVVCEQPPFVTVTITIAKV